MAKLVKYIFILMSATYFLFAGMGYNVVKYCCKGCEAEKINSFCSDKSKTCKFFRVMLDVPVINPVNPLALHAVKRFVLPYFSTQLSINQRKFIYSEIYFPPNNQRVSKGRDILSIKVILLI